MHRELAHFLDYCRVERRLALTCSAYERDVDACGVYGHGIVDALAAVTQGLN
jgi:site-specific recombinase XerC